MGWEDAVASVAGTAIGGMFGMKSNKASAKEAQKNRDWQERMDNTKHQREVQDLAAAGLNPILSANSAGSVPSGGVATQSNPFSGLGQEVNSALRLGRVEREKLALEQEIGEATIEQSRSQSVKNMAETNKENAEYDLINQNRANAASDNLIKAFQLKYVMPKHAELLASQSTAALASAGASTAQAAFDTARKNFVELDVNKRRKSKEIEDEAEYIRVLTEGTSNAAKAVEDVTNAVWNFAPWKRGTKMPNSNR